MPFRKNPIAPPVFQPVVCEHVVSDFNEDGQLITRVEYVDECKKESVDYREYSLRHQLESGDTIKQVRTDLLSDDYDSITTEMVEPYFEETTDENV